MKALTQASIAIKALQQLGYGPSLLFGLYQIGLRTRAFRHKTFTPAERVPRALQPLFNLPNPSTLLTCIGQEGLNHLVAHANEIVDRRIRLFGGDLQPLNLSQPDSLPHWTAYETSRVHPADIKYIWEPARMGWAFTLGRAYYLTRDERFPQVFWLLLEEFWEDNPVNRGPNWVSAQEVALRLMALVFAGQVFAHSIYTTPEKLARLAASVAEHAERIPPTLIYARAQNNNHLLSEAAGLITAALSLPTHPQAARWVKLGWKWFNHGLQTQIAEDGTYIQHSTNYHRLILQLALWVKRISGTANQPISKKASQRLQVATQWLSRLTDAVSGHTPNLGPNDGAYIFPLTICSFEDYRPVIQAASKAFLNQPACEPGPWDEMAMWFVESPQPSRVQPTASLHETPTIIHAGHSWAYLRAAKFTSRPGHVDQLHVDLWWRGLNIAKDAGTYLYNAHAPWDNRLCSAYVHNTVTVNGLDQMTRASKFLYLDWAQAEILTSKNDESMGITARHNGYRRLGIVHQRSIQAKSGEHWVVNDLLLPDEKNKHSSLQPATITLHWLLADWPYEFQIANNKLRIQSPYGWISLQVNAENENGTPVAGNIQIIRAGKMIYGTGSTPMILGWFSPTYGQKSPALSLRYETVSPLPVRLISEWHFPTTVEPE